MDKGRGAWAGRERGRGQESMQQVGVETGKGRKRGIRTRKWFWFNGEWVWCGAVQGPGKPAALQACGALVGKMEISVHR